MSFHLRRFISINNSTTSISKCYCRNFITTTTTTTTTISGNTSMTTPLLGQRGFSSLTTTTSCRTFASSSRRGSTSSRRNDKYDEDIDDDDDDDRKKTALILGSSGWLGRTVSRYLSTELDMQIIGADIVDLPNESDTILDAFIRLPTYDRHPGLGDVTEALIKGMSNALNDGEEVDAIICTSGGFQLDPKVVPNSSDVSEEEFINHAKSYGTTIDTMIEMNLYPVLAAGYVSNRYMADEGLFVTIGATAALGPTPGMLGYGLSKAGTHHFVQTLGEITGKAVTTRTKRQKARRLRKDAEYLDTLSVVGILPTTIDTPNNRDAMPQADFDAWTKPIHIAEEIASWIENPVLRPHSGSLVKVHPSKDGGASFTLVR